METLSVEEVKAAGGKTVKQVVKQHKAEGRRG